MTLAELIRDIPLVDASANITDIAIVGITEDSRKVKPGMIFAALPGVKADGMAFADDAIANGAVLILAGANAQSLRVSVPILRANEPRAALATIAARFYARQPKVIVGVTGTNGKTSVASFLRQIWSANSHAAASLGTIGITTAQVETPLSHTTPDPVTLHSHLARLAEVGITHLAIEASSHGLAQHRLDGVRMTAGAFTNITRDHLDYHETFEAYRAAKVSLFSRLLSPGLPAVIDADGEGASDFIHVASARGLDVATVGFAGDFIRVDTATRVGFKQRLTVSHANRRYDVELPLPGTFQMSNALVAAALAIKLGDDTASVFDALQTLRGAKGRLEYVGETDNGTPIFVDYAHTPDALAKALQALRPYVVGRLHVVFGCGGDRDAGKRPLMGAAAATFADIVYVTDDNPRTEDPALIRRAAMAAAPNAIEIGDRRQAIATAIAGLDKGDILLVAGKGHEPGQTIGTTVIPYSDHEAVETALISLGSRYQMVHRG